MKFTISLVLTSALTQSVFAGLEPTSIAWYDWEPAAFARAAAEP